MKTMSRLVAHPLPGGALAILLSGILPWPAQAQAQEWAVGEGDTRAKASQVLIVRDYAGYDEVRLPLDARTSAASGHSPMPEEPPQSRPTTPPLLDAAELSRGLDTNGKAVVGGIAFDARDELLESSKPALDQIGALLMQRPALRLHVVVHTDNTGALASNREISQRQAHAICVALVVDYGIARNRLTANGLGSLSPVVSNQSGRGRARNRRVELVVQ